MHKTLTRARRALLASPACADTLVINVNGIQVGADGNFSISPALLVGDDGKVRPC